MKIGIDARFLTHPQPGGFKTYTVNLLDALSRLDSINQYVIYLDRPTQEVLTPQQDNFIYHVVEGRLPLVGMPMREQIKLRRQIAMDKPDLVHFLCNTAPKNVSGKFVVTLHDTIQVTTEKRFKLTSKLREHKEWAITAYSKWAILNTVQTAQKIITVSNYEKKQIEEILEIGSHRICVTHLAANPIYSPASPEVKNCWREEVQQKYNIHDKFILTVGYEDRKNIPLLIEAFCKLAPTQPNLAFVIVAAEAAKRDLFDQLVAERNLTGRVFVLAAMSPNDLVKFYNLAEVFIFASERESFGLPPLEAVACGVPTIAMNMTSIPEILKEGALLVDGKEIEVWARVLTQVLDDDIFRAELTKKGLVRASELTWQKCAKETLEIYRSVVEK